MTLYATVKAAHVAFATASISGFALRGLWMLRGSALPGHRITRVLPHVVDTLLLASAVALAVMSRQYPMAQNWLTAKILALLLYIALGTVALRRGRSPRVRRLAFAGALTVFGYIVAVAVTRQPWPFNAT